jgi:hypothetical protein
MTWVPPLSVLVRYLIALIVVSHGITYIAFDWMGVSGAYQFAGWKGSSWLLGSAITGDALKTLTSAFWAIAGVGFIATGIVIAFSPLLQGFSRPLAIGASTVSILSFAIFWDGQTAHFPGQGGIGMILSLIILVSAIVFG